jgi:hypothetical protein
MVRLTGDVVFGALPGGGECYGPNCLWTPGSRVVWRMDAAAGGGRLPFSRATGARVSRVGR